MTDIYTKAIFNFLKENQNMTLLAEDIAVKIPCSKRTVARKIKDLCTSGHIFKNGKKYEVLKELV